VALNNQSIAVTNAAATFTDAVSANNRNINMFTAGVNYKFGPW
jgi:hypothetical protein